MALLIPGPVSGRKELPESVRDTAAALQRGLDDSVLLWLRKWKSRGHREYGFVVLLPERGIIVLHVIGRERGDVLGVFRGVLRVKDRGKEHESEAPAREAVELVKILRARIAAEKRLAGYPAPVASGLAFPTITREEAGRRGVTRIAGADCILTADAIQAARDGLSGDELRRALLAMLGPAQPLRPDEEKIKLLRGLLEPGLVIAGALKTGVAPPQENIIFPPPRGGVGDEVRVLDIAQESCAKKLGGGHRIIRGVAGSGKTLILVYRARLLASHSRNKRYLFTCYTRTLAAALRAQLADCANVEVGNLDRVMWDVIRAAGRVPATSADGEYDPEEIARIALPLLEGGCGPRYDGVLLDEAQDFGTDCLRFVLRLLKDPDGDLLIVSDAAQNIFGRKTVWKDAGIQAQGRTIVLKRNYRNTRQILDFANAFLMSGEDLLVSDAAGASEEDAVIPPEAAVREGPAPRVIFASHFEEIVGETVKQVRACLRRRSRARSVAVTYMTRAYFGRPLADDIRKALLGEGIDVFWMTDPARKDARADLPSVNAPVILSTVHSLKGLEFPAVVMSTLVFPNMTPLENRKLVYVGMTRACDELVLITQPGHPLSGILAGLMGPSKDCSA